MFGYGPKSGPKPEQCPRKPNYEKKIYIYNCEFLYLIVLLRSQHSKWRPGRVQ